MVKRIWNPIPVLPPMLMTVFACCTIGCPSTADLRVNSEAELRGAAARDFGCPESKLELQPMAKEDVPYKYSVSGCGKTETYVDTGPYGHDWEQESKVR